MGRGLLASLLRSIGENDFRQSPNTDLMSLVTRPPIGGAALRPLSREALENAFSLLRGAVTPAALAARSGTTSSKRKRQSGQGVDSAAKRVQMKPSVAPASGAATPVAAGTPAVLVQPPPGGITAVPAADGSKKHKKHW